MGIELNDESTEVVETPEVTGAPESGHTPEKVIQFKPANGTPSQDPLNVGELLPQEVMQIQQVRGRVNQILMEIGNLEVQKAMMMGKLEQLEQQGQGVVRQARLRLGVDDNETVQVTPDGKIRRLPKNMKSPAGN